MSKHCESVHPPLWLRRVVDLVSVHLETEHEELYREIDEFLKEEEKNG